MSRLHMITFPVFCHPHALFRELVHAALNVGGTACMQRDEQMTVQENNRAILVGVQVHIFWGMGGGGVQVQIFLGCMWCVGGV